MNSDEETVVYWKNKTQEEIIEKITENAYQYETFSAYSSLRDACRYFGIEGKVKDYWNDLDEDQRKMFHSISRRLSEISASRYEGQEELFAGIVKFDPEKHVFPCDMNLLNALAQFFHVKLGCSGWRIIPGRDDEYERKCIGEENCCYLEKLEINTSEKIAEAANGVFLKGDRFYIFYDFDSWRVGGKRMLPLFSKGKYISFRDVYDNVWPFAADSWRIAEKFSFYGWKNGIPVLELTEIDNSST